MRLRDFIKPGEEIETYKVIVINTISKVMGEPEVYETAKVDLTHMIPSGKISSLDPLDLSITMEGFYSWQKKEPVTIPVLRQLTDDPIVNAFGTGCYLQLREEVFTTRVHHLAAYFSQIPVEDLDDVLPQRIRRRIKLAKLREANS